MKLFPVRGGIHPDYRKSLSSNEAIVVMPMPRRLVLPLQQHIGAPAEVLVAAGEQVRKGQLLARGQGPVSAPLHAPTSGVIEAISQIPAPHPSGLPQTAIVLLPDGLDAWAPLPAPLADPFEAPPEAIREHVAQAGIVGMGGAAFPAAVKLGLGGQHRIDTLLINGAECEPYLTCDDRVMREHADDVVDGARLMARALDAPCVIIAIEANKPEAIDSISHAAAKFAEVQVVAVPVQYPMGSERHLVQAITGRETPARRLTADIGVVVHNPGTARAVHEAVRHGRPLTHRVVTVSGGAVRHPRNVDVALGTPVADLLAFCGGLTGMEEQLVQGGPMMGQPLPSLDVPVVKGTSGILALTAEEVAEQPASPCIRCGSCVSVCPCGLVPVELAAYIRKDRLEDAAKLGVQDCLSCGSCAWVCPSHIPLVQYFNYAKGRLNADAAVQRKNDRTRTLAEARTLRLEKAEAAKRAAAAVRQAAATANAATGDINA
ncbi:electron transport complex subunit RsxC [Azoarcus sp. DN11]|uniref:electron transport complex subunit RsxC n=1 Tax=Azoarcus sp. DN11 TaxID=356837 RepID=UPI000EAF5A03|nr:electron transport complex subunit RsxC [Azoarcus sp. DN11]AYH44995.1 electron transport complex subunit RsxC [Azoarcus sp. DN11]